MDTEERRQKELLKKAQAEQSAQEFKKPTTVKVNKDRNEESKQE